MTWRTATILLALASCWLLWRDCRRPPAKAVATSVECEHDERSRSSDRSRDRSSDRSSERTGDRSSRDSAESDGDPKRTDGLSVHGFHVPSWALGLLPQPGEELLAYRDRIVPLAQAAIAPHRARVVRGRDDFARAVNLDAQQRTELEAAVQEAGTQIQDRLLGAALGGELAPSTFKPMAGVALAREVLDVVARANKRFLASLREDQRTALASHPFDIGDYLLFSTRWEDALGYSGR